MVDVVVPTYRRPAQLERCLQAIAAQTRPASQIVVVARRDDVESHAVVADAAEWSPSPRLVTVNEPGVIAAMSGGVAATTAPIVAFTDDDAAPHRDWLDRMLSHFDDPTVGAVGGRDIISGQSEPLCKEVGLFRRSGMLVGNHHLGTGPARDVDVLKGVNIAFRADALALPRAGVLRGKGAQVDWEVMCCSHARQSGWRVVYDPALLVDHHPAPRHDADQRGRPQRKALFDAAYNSVAACAAVPGLWPRRAAFGVLVGGSGMPGVGRALAALLRREGGILGRVLPSLAGQVAGLIEVATSSHLREDPVVTAGTLRGEGRLGVGANERLSDRARARRR